ncbi:MAG: hypothetical protein KDK97_09180 [Verrucomicrobiales bacterium]|nr:hypothetical protein [Verrucomicrobiales bacterium]
MSAEQLATAIIRHASQFLGLREVRPNADWDNPATPAPDRALAEELRTLMRPSPWAEGWAYCAAFCEGMVLAALRSVGASPDQCKRWQDTMTPHCVTSARNFKKLGLLVPLPASGAVWLAQHGSGSNGHAGLVTAVRGMSMATIEANTSLDQTSPEKDREGDWITTRLSYVKGRGSLHTLGFVHPASILKLTGL